MLAAALLWTLVACSGGAVARPPGAPSGSPAPARQAQDRSEPRHRAIAAIREGSGWFVAIPRMRYVPMWDRPDPDPADYVFDARSPNGGRAPMLVADARVRDGVTWLELYLPIRPNGVTGWVREQDVRLRPRHERIEVDLSRRILVRYVDGVPTDRFRVGVGAPAYPTGTGTFYVWVKVAYDPPHPAYGVYALGLSGFSPVLSDWPGEGRMAIHGTPNAADRGRAVSHGCVRVWNPDMERLVDVPLGTPVIIRP
ncbi:Putative L,D-transpeptidase YkuD [bacterium HR12]|nr:Putative L,D-transpeptidase YkuD [bacterium HR12]